MSNALTKFYLPAFFAAGLATAGSAMAGSTIELGYVVEVAGATMMKASFSTELDSGSFESSLSGKTAGMSDMFSGYKMNWSTTGIFEGGHFSPQSYENTRKKKSKKAKSTTIDWKPDGAVVLSNGTALPADIAAALNAPSTDPLTAVLKIASTQSRKPCFGTFRIYDGKDVFDLSLSFKKKITLASSPGLPGLDCRLTSTPVAGKDVRNGDTEPQSYGLTLTPITAAGQTLYIPVLITGSTKGVGVTVSASYLKVDGKSVSAMLQ